MDNVFQKGIPLTIAWNLTKPDGSAFDLNGYSHRMFYTVGNRHKEVSGTAVSGNVISWVFPANDQTAAGDYTMTLMLYQNGSLFCKLNYANAFSLFHGSAAGGNSSQQQQTSNVVNLYSAAEYYLFQPVVPVVGDDGFWWVNGARLVTPDGENVSADHTITYHADTNYIVIDEGRVDAHGQSIAQTITSLKDALDVAAGDHNTATEDHRVAGLDHGTAGEDHTTAQEDHRVAGLDHVQAGEDHGVAQEDHRIAGLDHYQAGEDHEASGAATQRANDAAAAAEHQVDVKRGYGIKTVTQPVVATTNGGTNTIKVTTDDDREYLFYVKNGKSSAGFFNTSADLNTGVPSPNVGDYAFVSKAGDNSFPAYIYVCTTAGTWTATEAEYDGDNVDLSNYATKDYVSVSQNTNTGHTDITVGGVTTPVASVEDVSQLFPLTKVDVANLTLLGNAHMGNSTAGSSARMKIVSSSSSNIIYYYRVFKDVTYKLFSDLNWQSVYCAIGFSQALPVIGNSYDAQIVASDSPTSANGIEYTPQTDGYLLLQYHSSSISAVYAPTPIGLSERLNSLDEGIDGINDILTEKIYTVLQKGAETGGFLDASGRVRVTDSTNYGLYYYQVSSGEKIHIQIGVLQDADYKSAGFFAGATMPADMDTLSPIFGVSNASTDVTYDVPQNGWIVCRWRNAVLPVLTKIEITENVGLKTINGRSVAGVGNLEIGVRKPLENKTVAIFGDSIIQLFEEETSPSLGGTITLKNYSDPTDTTVYQIEDSTVIDGIIYLTSSLSGGQPILTSIRLEIVNSNQSTLDNMTWESLRSRLSADDVIGLGFGGASIRQKGIGITTQYPICGLLNEGAEDAFGNTVNLPNEVKMLKRLVDNGIRETPDCCIIWMGVNSSHIREGKTLDWAMQLDYATLADDVLGFDDRCEFFGGLRYAVETLYREFPYTTIILVSPYQTAFADHTSDGTPDNYRGYSFLDNVSNAMRDLAKRYSCIFIDAFHEIGIANFAWKANSADGKHAEAPTLGNLIPLYTRDGLHPSSEGKVLLLNYLTKRIETLYFAKKDS